MVNDKIDVGLRLGLDEKSKASVKSQVDKLKKEFETLKKESIQLSSKELDLQKKMLVNEGLRLKNQRLQISVEKEKAKVSQNASKSELDLANRKLKEQKQMLVNDGIAVKNKQKILAVEKKETLEIEKQNKASITKLAKEEKSLQNQKVSLAIFKEQQARSVTGLETGTLKGTYNTAELDKFKASVDALKTTTPDLNNQMRTLKSQFKNIETNARTSSRAIKEAADNTVTLGSQLKNAFGKFILWMGVTTVFFGVVRALRSGIDTVIELDTALVELKKVTDETETSYNKFLKTSIDVSKSLGRTTVETLNATSAFARMGYTINESLELAKSSLTLLNVADDIETVDEATNSLITALKGFQLEADMSVKIVDSLNNVSNKFAVTTGDLSEGVRRTSATMNSAGNSFDQLNGMLVGANEGMKNIEKSSSGLNTISMRLRGVGEDTEGLVPKLKEAFDQIGESGVAIEDSAGNLRSTYDILNDLAGSYDTISSKQQQYVAELAAGKKQAAVFYNLMSNWDNVVKATAASIDSVGSATKEQEKVLESVQGRLNILSSTADEFWVSFISSDLLKGGISGLTELLNILNKILDTFGGMGVILPILIGTIAIFKKTILVGLIAQLQYIPVVLSYIIAGITGVTVSLGVATALLSGLTLVLGAAFLAWKSNNKAQEEAIDNLNQLEDGLKGANEQFTKTSEMIDAFEELSNKINKTAVETAEMNSLQGKLNEIMPEVKNKIDGQNISLDEQIELYKELNNAIKEKAINEAQDILDRFSGTYDERATKIEENEAALREYNASLANQREQLRLLQEKYPKSTAMINIQRNAIDNTKDSMDKLNEETEDLININRNLANAEDLVAQSKSEIIQSSDLLISSYEDEMGIIGDLADKNEEQLGKMLKDEKELTEGLRQEITKRLLMRRAEFDPTTITVAGGIEVQTHGFSGSDDPVIKGLKDRLDTINKIYAENTIKISNQILGLGGDASTSTSDNTKYLSEQQQALNKVNSELSLLENNYKTIENGSDKLVAKYKEQQDALHNLADLLRVQLTLLDPTTQEYADLQNTIDGLSNSWWSAEKSISDFNKELEDEALKKAEEALKRANEALKDYKENLEDLAKTYQDDFSRGIDKGIARLEELRDLEDDSIQSSIDGIESKIESMEEANRTQSESNDLAEKQLALSKLLEERSNILSNRNTRIIDESGSISYVADKDALIRNSEAIASKEKDIADAMAKYTQDSLLRELEYEKQVLQEKKDANKDFYSSKIDTLKKFEDEAKWQIEESNVIQKELLTELNIEMESINDSYFENTLDGYQTMVANINATLRKIEAANLKAIEMEEAESLSSGYSSSRDTSKIGSSGKSTTKSRKLSNYSSMWNKADDDVKSGKISKAESDRIKNYAHTSAEAVRSTRGYSGGDDGSGYIKLATGGVVSGTGIAQLDGTSTKPELVLNSNAIDRIGSSMGLSGSTTNIAQGILAAGKTPEFVSGGNGNNSHTVKIQNVNIEQVNDLDSFIDDINRVAQTSIER